MRHTRRQFLHQTVLGTAGLLSLGVARGTGADARRTGTTAIAASDFLNSLGVCSSITGRGEILAGTI